MILPWFFGVFEKAGRAQPLNRQSLFAIQWIERIGFSLPAFTGFDTQLSGLDPLRRIYGLTPLPPTPLHQYTVTNGNQCGCVGLGRLAGGLGLGSGGWGLG